MTTAPAACPLPMLIAVLPRAVPIGLASPHPPRPPVPVDHPSGNRRRRMRPQEAASFPDLWAKRRCPSHFDGRRPSRSLTSSSRAHRDAPACRAMTPPIPKPLAAAETSRRRLRQGCSGGNHTRVPGAVGRGERAAWAAGLWDTSPHAYARILPQRWRRMTPHLSLAGDG